MEVQFRQWIYLTLLAVRIQIFWTFGDAMSLQHFFALFTIVINPKGKVILSETLHSGIKTISSKFLNLVQNLD